MEYLVLFTLSALRIITSTFFFLIFKLGSLGAMQTIIPTIIQTIFYLVIIAVMFYILCLIGELIDYFYKKIKNFVKKLLTKIK